MPNGIETNKNHNNSICKDICKYSFHHDPTIDNEIYVYLMEKYEEKGRDFFFKVSQLPFSYLSGQRKGAALRRISEKFKVVEKWNTGQIIVWHTNFNNGFAP